MVNTSSADGGPADPPDTDPWFSELIRGAIESLSPEEQAEFVRRVEEDEDNSFLTSVLEQAVHGTIVETVPVVAAELERTTPRLIRDQRRDRQGFDKRLRRYWAPALDRLEAMINGWEEYGEAFAAEGDINPALRNSALHAALVRLNARGTRIATEIWTLLAAGLPDGAMARWRTLHEVAIVSNFLRDHGEEAAARYLAHERLCEIALFQTYHRYDALVPEQKLTDDDVAELETERRALLEEFGEQFEDDYGWAALALQIDRPRFFQLEAAVEMQSVRPVFRAASAHVHAGADGLLGIAAGYSNGVTTVAGPSNMGLAEPGRYTANTLVLLALPLAVYEPTFDRLFFVAVLAEMGRRCHDEFLACEAALLAADDAYRSGQNGG